MKSFNIEYRGRLDIINFIRNNKINNYDNILVQVFSGIVDREIIKTVVKEIKELIPNAVIIGTTTDGEISGSNIFTESIVLSISLFEKTKIVPFFYETESNYYAVGEKIGRYTPLDTKCAIMFSDGLNSNGEDLIKGIESCNGDLIVSGGMAGDNASFIDTLVFNDDYITNRGVVGVYLQNRDLIVNTEYLFGWIDIGKKFQVTKSYKNRVFELDNSFTAIEIYEKYLGKEIAKDLPSIGIEFPFIINRNGIKVARAVLSKNSDGSLVFAGNINEGEYVKFGIANIQIILDEIYSKISNFTKYPIESIFIYSCMARRRFLKHYIKTELQLLDVISTVSGFYTYGEFFSNNKYKNLHNETTTILMLSENKNAYKEISLTLDSSHQEYDRTVKAFNNLINSITDELESLNEHLEEEVQRKVEELKRLLYYDDLTGIYSKNKLLEDLNKINYKYLILINIDDFSKINFAYGFEMGDFILKSIVDYYKTILGENDYLYRVGGDEFVILTNNDYFNLIDKINKFFLENPIIINNIPFFISFSFGVARNNSKHTLREASIALKNAKQTGKHRVVIFNEQDSIRSMKESIKITSKLVNAIKENGIIPFYQGLRDNRTGKINKYEVLVRMRYKDKLYSPFFFLEEAKVLGLLPEITKIMIDKSFNYMKNKDFSFSINITDEDLEKDDFIDYVLLKIQEHKIEPSRVYFEILENIGIDSGISFRKLKELQNLGFNIAIDDFGAKYSNFARIQEINADIIKIDGQYIKDIDVNEKHYKIVKSIVNLARDFNAKVVAEFVHNDKVQKIVQELGIDYSQGFYFSEPKEFID